MPSPRACSDFLLETEMEHCRSQCSWLGIPLRAAGPRMLRTSGSAHPPHKARVGRQLYALEPELRFVLL